MRGDKNPQVFYGIFMRQHLHIRGEKGGIARWYENHMETPPHTWRKVLEDVFALPELGNTSTYVEKSP